MCKLNTYVGLFFYIYKPLKVTFWWYTKSRCSEGSPDIVQDILKFHLEWWGTKVDFTPSARRRCELWQVVTLVIWAFVSWPSFLPLLSAVLWLPSGRPLRGEVSQAHPHRAADNTHTPHPPSTRNLKFRSHTRREADVSFKIFSHHSHLHHLNSHHLMWFLYCYTYTCWCMCMDVFCVV